MNTRINLGRLIAAAVLAGSTLSAGAATAETDASLTQVFEAVCLKPADAEGRRAAAYAHGLRTPPKSFQGKPPGGKNATLELNVWKALEGRMLMLYVLVEPFPGTTDLPALTCQAVLTPGDNGALTDASAVLGVDASTGDAASGTLAFEDGAEGLKALNMDDDAAMDAAMQSGRLRIVSFSRSNPKDDQDILLLLRPLAP